MPDCVRYRKASVAGLVLGSLMAVSCWAVGLTAGLIQSREEVAILLLDVSLTSQRDWGNFLQQVALFCSATTVGLHPHSCGNGVHSGVRSQGPGRGGRLPSCGCSSWMGPRPSLTTTLKYPLFAQGLK